MATFVFRLQAPRPNFALDMTEEEREIMTRHAAYWQPLIHSGQMVIFGPVLDGTGSWTFAPQHSATAAALSTCPGQISPARTSRPGHLTEGEPVPGQPARRVALEASCPVLPRRRRPHQCGPVQRRLVRPPPHGDRPRRHLPGGAKLLGRTYRRSPDLF